FVWARPAAECPDSPAMQLWGTLFANVLILSLALWRESGFGRVDPMAVAAAPLMVLLFFGVRHLAMLLAARRKGLAVRYRAWESGFPLSIVIALLTGNLFPMPGSVYPASDRWRYWDLLPKLGVIALAGVLPELALAWGIWAYIKVGAPPAGVAMWLGVALKVAKPLALFDTALVFFPFVSFNGRRLWDWKCGVWVVLAVAAVVVFL
ncbi:MAG: hypothetical protein JXA42_20055, partial [Anaerolineales bacterium]|nr:hypothetical protein [Anaerolineales bacterium]